MTSHPDTCPSCESHVTQGQTHCSCGRPTSYASFTDRAAYEVSQWRAYKESVSAPAGV
jgi:hypothetical protein